MYLHSLIPKFPLGCWSCLSVPSLESLCWCRIKTQVLLFCPPPGRHHWLLPRILNPTNRHICTALTGERLASVKSRAASSPKELCSWCIWWWESFSFFIQVMKCLLYHQKEEAECVGYMVQMSLPSGGEERKPEKWGADFIERGNFHQFEEWWKLLVVPSPFNPFQLAFYFWSIFLGHVTLLGMPIIWLILTCGLKVYL